jgi:NAD(P)-dependent dehydrogenase (short-subunit alcohol dehydrogenase family)
MLAKSRVETRDGIELTFATHVVGPFLLTQLLLPKLQVAAPSRVITVSSGGMYARRLTVNDLQSHAGAFDGVVAYARAKRAQVVLNELWSERTAGTGIAFHCMHPGWADTDALRDSLPGFFRVMRSSLRTPAQGADTVVFLAVAACVAASSGRFWFDREPQPTHIVPWTRETNADRARLWDACSEFIR